MRLLTSETLPLRLEADLLLVRLRVRERATELSFSTLDVTKLVTVASELGRNTLVHGGGGTALIEALADGPRIGLRLSFEDRGPGIADLTLALTDGFSTNRGMGLGLSGSKRLMDELEITSRVGEGTRVMATRWT